MASKKPPKRHAMGDLAIALHHAWIDVMISNRGYVLMTKDGAKRIPPDEVAVKKPQKKGRT